MFNVLFSMLWSAMIELEYSVIYIVIYIITVIFYISSLQTVSLYILFNFAVNISNLDVSIFAVGSTVINKRGTSRNHAWWTKKKNHLGERKIRIKGESIHPRP